MQVKCIQCRAVIPAGKPQTKSFSSTDTEIVVGYVLCSPTCAARFDREVAQRVAECLHKKAEPAA